MEDFEKLYVAYMETVYRFLLKMTGNPDIAEELTQETFVKAFEHIGEFEGRCKLSVWLCQIAKHAYFAYYREHKNLAGEGLPCVCVNGTDIEQNVIKAEERIHIHEVLHGLKEPYKEVFMLRVMGELSYRDISQIFQKSESWARVTYYRAKGMIQERMEGGGENEM